jgi:hypothetical protein
VVAPSTAGGDAGDYAAGSAAAPHRSAADDIAALKRLQREAFTELFALRNQLQDLAAKVEEGSGDGGGDDDDEGGGGGGSGGRRALRVTALLNFAAGAPLGRPAAGDASGSGSGGGDAAAEGAPGLAWGPSARLYLHTLLDARRRHRLTAKLVCGPAASGGGAAAPGAAGFRPGGGSGAGGEPLALALQQLMYRGQLGERATLLAAATGGQLAAIAPALVRDAGLGATRAFAEQSDVAPAGAGASGPGLAAAYAQGAFHAAAGAFWAGGAAGDAPSTALRLGVADAAGASIGLDLTQRGGASGSIGGVGDAAAGATRMRLTASYCAGEALLAAAHAVRSSCGGRGWGASLQTLPDAGGVALGVAVLQPCSVGVGGVGVGGVGEADGLQWELAARWPLAPGLCLKPGVAAARGGDGRLRTTAFAAAEWRL